VENLSLSDKTVFGDALMVLNCFSYALCLSYSKKFLENHDPIWATVWMFVYGSVGLTLLAIPQWMTFQWPTMTAGLWAAAFFAVIGATLLTYFLNFWALAHARSSQVALFIYIQPVITAGIAWMWMGEAITLRSVLATLFIFIGMVLGLSKAQGENRLGDSDR
jgi:drug/metabolite transporter (DMT)-like permease